MSDTRPTLARRRFLQQASMAAAGTAVATLGLGAGVAGAQTPRVSPTPGRNDRVADIVLHNAKIITMNPATSRADAIAIKDGQVLQVGTINQLRTVIGARTEQVNLRGATVLPGMNDTHVHASSWATQRPPYTLDVGYPTVRSIADIVAMVAGAVQQLPPGEWVRGSGWDQSYFAEGRAPTRQDLDAVSPNNPVRLGEWSFHAAWVNTRALEIAGITRDTVPPPGGVIVKDADGEPTGLLLEGAANLVRAPGFSAGTQLEAVQLATRELHAQGVTGFTDVGVSQSLANSYTDLANAGTLRQRVVGMISGGNNVNSMTNAINGWTASSADPRWFSRPQVKIFADGVPTVNRTAWVSEPYIGGGTGGLTINAPTVEEQVAQLQQMILLAHQAGLQIGTHACGDRTIDVVVDAYIDAMNSDGRRDARHYVIHGDLASPAALQKMGANGIGASLNANIKWIAADGMVESLGRPRADYQWPYRSALDAGVRATSSSDAPIALPDARQSIETMVTRRGRQSGEVFGANQRISLAEAIATHTTNAAWQDHAEGYRGTLAPGMVADLTVLEGDLTRVPADEITDVPVQLTMVDGEVVFDEVSASDRRVRDLRNNLSWVKRQRPGADHCCGGHDH